jgi:mRNA-degrading endonuclease YafQ of YafQ-DinJ toxin-antitoxin module
MKYRFRASRAFWRNFEKLTARQQENARKVFVIFKQNPFDPRLRSHKIGRLSARYDRTIYAAEIETDLRAVFYLEGDTIVTVDIGSHDIYRG